MTRRSSRPLFAAFNGGPAFIVPCIWVCSGSEQRLDVFGIAMESCMAQRGSASIVLDVRVCTLGQKVINAVMPHIEGREMYWSRVCVTCSVQSRPLKLLRFRGRLRTVATKRSDVNSLDLVERELLAEAVVELRSAGGLVSGDAVPAPEPRWCKMRTSDSRPASRKDVTNAHSSFGETAERASRHPSILPASSAHLARRGKPLRAVQQSGPNPGKTQAVRIPTSKAAWRPCPPWPRSGELAHVTWGRNPS